VTRARQPRAVRCRNWITHYSDYIEGADGNYGWLVRFDKTRGFIGITQSREKSWADVERVLLSPAQFKALIEFVSPLPAKKANLSRSKRTGQAAAGRPGPAIKRRRKA